MDLYLPQEILKGVSFEYKYEDWTRGPVYIPLYNAYRGFKGNHEYNDTNYHQNKDKYAKLTKEFNKTFDWLEQYHTNTLIDLSHYSRDWKKAYISKLNVFDNKIMEWNYIKDDFSDVVWKYKKCNV